MASVKVDSASGSLLVFFLLVGFIFVAGVDGQSTKSYEFVLRESNFTRLCSTKSMLAVNGTFPGPVLIVNEGDTVLVNVRNEASENITIHWHGVKQPGNPWSDGPAYITQCPIQPRTNFTYRILFTDEIGTLWWHAHIGWARATVLGAIAIRHRRGRAAPFPTPAGEQSIVLASWYKSNVNDIINEALLSGGEPNVSDAYTINGQPGYLYECSNTSTFRMAVVFGRTYLLRIVNGVLNEDMFFGVRGHRLRLVGVDAAYVKPLNVNFILISPGQAMDVLLTADQNPDVYSIAAKPFSPGAASFSNTTTTALLIYTTVNSTPDASPAVPQLPAYDDISAATNFTTRIRALGSAAYPVTVPTNISTRIFITISINLLPCTSASCGGSNGSRLSASLNNISFVTPSIAILNAYSQGRPNYRGDFPIRPPRMFNFTGNNTRNATLVPTLSTSVREISFNDSVEIILQGTNLNTRGAHPMHLHGFSFYLMGAGTGNYNATIHASSLNLVDPPLINTVLVPMDGWAVIRFFANNPGVWFMHCHLERHASWGMDTVFIVRDGPRPNQRMLPRPSYVPPC